MKNLTDEELTTLPVSELAKIVRRLEKNIELKDEEIEQIGKPLEDAPKEELIAELFKSFPKSMCTMEAVMKMDYLMENMNEIPLIGLEKLGRESGVRS